MSAISVAKATRCNMQKVALDTNILIHGVQLQTSPGEEWKAERAAALLARLEAKELNHYGLEAHRLDSGWKPGFRLKPTESSTLEA